jgi:hypothetical protein
MVFLKEDGKSWKLIPVKGESFGIYFNNPPNRFHRWMQSFFFGFTWRRE